MSTDITRVPTLQDIYDSKDAMDDIQSFTYDITDSFVDANGVTRDTVTGRIKKMGFAVPIVYAGGIVFAANDNVKTVEEAGVIYAPLPSALPFTTSGTFTGDDDDRFFVVQNIGSENEVNIDEYITNPALPSSGINNAAAVALAEGKTLVSHDRSVTYVLDAQIDLLGLKWIDIKAEIDTSAIDGTETGGAILLGGLAQKGGGIWVFGPITGSGVGLYGHPTYPQVRVSGSKGVHMQFDYIQYLQFYQTNFFDGLKYTQSGNAYNQIFCSNITSFIEVESEAFISEDLWFNENTVYGGRLNKVRFSATGGYRHNNNKFLNPLFEGSAVEIDIETGHSNWFKSCRFENTGAAPGITLGATASVNTFSRSYNSSFVNREIGFDLTAGAGFDLDWNDSGHGNTLHYERNEDWSRDVICSLSPKTTVISCGTSTTSHIGSSDERGVLDNQTIPINGASLSRPRVVPGIDYTAFPDTFSRILQTDLIAVHSGSVFQIAVELGEGSWRYSVEMFDENKVPLSKLAWVGAAAEDSGISAQSSTAYGSGDTFYSVTANLTGSYKGVNTNPTPFTVVDPSIKYVVVTVYTGSIAPTTIRTAAIAHLDAPEGNIDTLSSGGIGQKNKPLSIDFAPTTGRATLGTIIQTPDFDYKCTFELTTANSAEVAALATSITVDSVTNTIPSTTIENTDIVGILLDDGTTHWDVVAGLSGSTFTIGALTSPIGTLGAKALVGAPVVFIRWEVSSGGGGGVTDLDGLTDAVNSVAPNLGLGTNALAAITSGIDNVIIGINTGDNITSANNCVALGSNALGSTAGGGATAIGKNSQAVATVGGNTSLGSDSLKSLTTGAQNVAIGRKAMEFASFPLGCTAVGFNAGASLTGGNYCVMIGNSAGSNVQSGINNIAIGGSALDTCTVGANNTAVGNQALWLTTGDHNFGLGKNAGADITSGSSNICIGSNVDAGLATSTYRIVIGDNIAGTSDNEFSFGRSANVVSNNFGTDALWSRASDARKKTNVKDLVLGRAFLLDLRAVLFNWLPEWGTTDIDITGFIYQEVKAVCKKHNVPTFHILAEDNDGYGRLKEAVLIPILVKGFQEQDRYLQDLEARLRELEAK